MIRVRDVVYLLDMDGLPLRSITTRYDLSVEHVDGQGSTLTMSVPIGENIQPEQQFVYRGNRYTVTEVETIKSSQEQTITADVDYLGLAERLCTIDEVAISVADMAQTILEGTKYTVESVLGDENAVSMRMENITVLAALRQLATISGLVLSFDSVGRTVSYKPSDAGSVGFLLRYRKNLNDVTRRMYKPRATVIYPYGNEGLTIESVNDGVEYVEDFGWYTDQGYTLEEARENFTKVQRFEDSLFIYAGHLKKEAEDRLRELARPQIAYDVSVGQLAAPVTIGQYGYVVDDELDIKVNVKVVRVIEHEDTSDNQIELNYLVEDMSDHNPSSTGATSGGGIQTVLVYSRGPFEGTQDLKQVIALDFTNTSDINAMSTINIHGELSQQATIEGVIDIDGLPVDYPIAQTAIPGKHLLSYSFIIPKIEAGSHRLRLLMKTDAGSLSIPKGKTSWAIQAENLAGGLSASRPEINVVEDVIMREGYTVTDGPVINTAPPIPSQPSESVTFASITVTDAVSVDLN